MSKRNPSNAIELETESAPVIRLPDDPALVERLSLKRDEYARRHLRFMSTHYVAPENDPRWYRWRVLDELLKRRELNTWDFCRELNGPKQMDGLVNVPHYESACKVIDDYTKGREIEFKEPERG
jgi:hypothetical protein